MNSVSLENLGKVALKQGHPFRILIVDDEPWIREVFQDFCRLTNAFEIELASSGEEAIKKVSGGKFDLITMDLIMPEMSGLDALQEIKRILPRVPIMVVTGNATDKLIKEAGVIGACQVMYKPVMLDDFISALYQTLVK